MKKRLLFWVTFLVFALRFETVHAYLVAFEPAKLREGVQTDVFVAGFGDNQGTQFLKAAILAAKVSRDRFPQRQRVIISALNGSMGTETSMLKNAGMTVRRADEDDLNKSRLVRSLQNLSVPVSSLQFFGHANTYNGFRLQERSDRISQEDEEFRAIGSVLAKNAIVVFHSCNSGWLIAPAGARMWNRPVFGSMTGSNFQEMMSDGRWYFHDEGDYPSNLRRIGSTSTVVRESTDCRTGNCLRLKPGNKPYSDSFGEFSRGLGFYRGFTTAATAHLLPQAMVHLTLLTPSESPLSLQSSRDEYVKALADWMCPQDKSNDKREACTAAIQTRAFEINPHLSFFRGTAVACTNDRCGTRVKCTIWKKVLGLVPCYTEDVSSARSTVFSDQLKAAFKGFDMLEKGQLSL
ncbi:hypothetical protein [Bdellovibrio sp. HCB2-146]|uniref:hypothetical protein n=1 Tax=Bdellovibrio sp. HCB2-146 TaxID=3394362 RepID=UPI0039BD7D91